MPGRKKKPFIDRKSAVSFHLVHRSQRDPLQADEESSKFVLLQKQKAKEKEELEKQKSAERELGVFYDDDYNYLQHLKDVNPACVWSEPTTSSSSTQERKVHFNDQVPPQVSKLGLPSDVFPSETEEKVGLLNKAAPVYGPRLDLDPDLVAAMDEDFDFEDPDNELEDDFILIAQDETEIIHRPSDGTGSGSDADDDDEEDYSTDELEDSDAEGDANYDQKTYLSEETKSHFTSYSITSSVMRRNDGLTLLDDRFEKLYEQYDDMEIGALDHDDIDGHREVDTDNAIMKQVMDEYIVSQQKSSLGDIRREGKLEDGERPSAEYEDDVDDNDDGDEKEDRVKLTVTETKKEERWDCESILSTYSTLYNHPTTIKEPNKKKSIRLSQKTGMPLDTLPSPGPTKKQQERELHDEYTLPSIAPTRPTDRKETPEEKKLRKQAVKEDRRFRRLEKKANKQAFKNEEKIQGLAMVNLKKNMRGIKIV